MAIKFAAKDQAKDIVPAVTGEARDTEMKASAAPAPMDETPLQPKVADDLFGSGPGTSARKRKRK